MADNLKDTLHREQDKNGDTKYVAGVDPDTGDPIYADTLWEAQNKKINNEMSTFKDRWKDSVSHVFKKQEGFALDKEFWTDGWTENKFYTKEGQGELWYDGAVPSFVKSMADSTFFKNLKWDGDWSEFWESFGDSWKKSWAEFGKTAEDYWNKAWNKENAEAMQAAVNQSKPWLEMYPSAMQQRMKTLATYSLAETDTKIKSVTKDTNNWKDVWSEFNQTNWVHGILNFKESTGMSGAGAISFLTDTKPFIYGGLGMIPKKFTFAEYFGQTKGTESRSLRPRYMVPIQEYYRTLPNVSYWTLISQDESTNYEESYGYAYSKIWKDWNRSDSGDRSYQKFVDGYIKYAGDFKRAGATRADEDTKSAQEKLIDDIADILIGKYIGDDTNVSNDAGDYHYKDGNNLYKAYREAMLKGPAMYQYLASSDEMLKHHIPNPFRTGYGDDTQTQSSFSDYKDKLKDFRKDKDEDDTRFSDGNGKRYRDVGKPNAESYFKNPLISDIPDRESEEASEDIDNKIKDDTSQLPRYSTIIPNDMSDLVKLRNACFSNNYNTMILIHNRSEETATINGMLTTLKDSHGKMDPNALLIDLIDKSESFATDGEANDINDILAHTFMYRSKGITIPEVKSASATIESYGISSDHVFYGVPSYSNKGKISFIMDRELALFAALGALSGMPHATKTDSGVDGNHSTMLLNNLRSERFYKNYEVTIISGFFGMNAMSHEAYEYIQRTNDGVKVLTDEEMYTLMNGNIKKNNKGAKTLSATNIHSGSSLMFVLSDVRMLGSGSSISLKQGNASQVEVPYDFTFKEMVALRANYL